MFLKLVESQKAKLTCLNFCIILALTDREETDANENKEKLAHCVYDMQTLCTSCEERRKDFVQEYLQKYSFLNLFAINIKETRYLKKLLFEMLNRGSCEHNVDNQELFTIEDGLNSINSLMENMEKFCSIYTGQNFDAELIQSFLFEKSIQNYSMMNNCEDMTLLEKRLVLCEMWNMAYVDHTCSDQEREVIEVAAQCLNIDKKELAKLESVAVNARTVYEENLKFLQG